MGRSHKLRKLRRKQRRERIDKKNIQRFEGSLTLWLTQDNWADAAKELAQLAKDPNRTWQYRIIDRQTGEARLYECGGGLPVPRRMPRGHVMEGHEVWLVPRPLAEVLSALIDDGANAEEIGTLMIEWLASEEEE